MEKSVQKGKNGPTAVTNKVKWMKTIMILSFMFCHCLGFYSFFSTIMDFIELLDTSIHTPSIGLQFRCIGCCIGCLAGAFIYQLGDKLMICSIFLIVEGIAVGFIPNFSCVHTYYFFKFVIGLTGGGVKTGCILVLSDLWREKSNPLIQTLDFVDLMAGVISPIIVQPFLSQSPEEKTGLQLGNATENVSTVEPLESEEKSESSIWLPLGTFGLLMNVTALIALIMYFATHKSSKTVKTEIENCEQVEKKEEKEDVNSTRLNYKEKRYAIIVTAVFCFIVLIYNVEIMSFFQLWTTFVMNSEMKISKSTAVFMLSAFPLAMASSSVAAILLSIKVKSLKIIMGLLMFRIIGNIIVVFNNVTLLWIGGILMSIGFGPFNATLFNCLKERVTVTNIVGSIATFCQFFSTAAAVTVLIGYFMQHSPLVLIYCNLGVIMTLIVGFATVSMLDRWKQQKSDENTKI